MNVVITPTEYKGTQVYFTEKKPNTHIPNSTFNRITYSTADFMMNGIYIQFELFVRQIDQNFNSNIYNCMFDPNHDHNQTMLSIFQRIESGILDKWLRLEQSTTSTSTSTSTSTPSQKQKSTDIVQQLRGGVISVWKNDFHYNDKPQFQHFIIKISGLWENEGGCGLTYKFI
jgi:hypothetical protein